MFMDDVQQPVAEILEGALRSRINTRQALGERLVAKAPGRPHGEIIYVFRFVYSLGFYSGLP